MDDRDQDINPRGSIRPAGAGRDGGRRPLLTDPLGLRDALGTVERTVPQSIAGRVTELTGLVLRATAPGARVGELVEIERRDEPTGGQPLLAEVVGFRGEEVVLLPLGAAFGIGPNSVVRPLGRPFTIHVGPPLLGRVLDAYAQPIDSGPSLYDSSGGVSLGGPASQAKAQGTGSAAELTLCPVERDAPEPLRRRRVTEPLSLGIRAIDGCLTVGQGQRVGLFAGPGLGKTTLLGQIARNTSADVTVIGLIGERGREVSDFVDTQLDAAAQKRTIVVCATSDQSPLLRLKAALSATTIAEYFRDRGKRVLLLLDSLTRVARAQREVGLAAGELPARQGYPPSVFALLPRLLERTGQAEFGSITAVYAVLVTGLSDDADDIVAEEVRATLDGHVELGRELAERGHHPAIDILRSLSRVMDDIVDPTQRQAAAKLREVLAIAARQRDLVLLGAYQRGSDPRTDAALDKLPAIEAFLRQDRRDRSDFTETKRRLLALFSDG